MSDLYEIGLSWVINLDSEIAVLIFKSCHVLTVF